MFYCFKYQRDVVRRALVFPEDGGIAASSLPSICVRLKNRNAHERVCLLPLDSNSKFVSNGVRRGGSGGAMWVENRATATLVHTSFVNNTAASSYTHKAIGGAISISGSARLELVEGCSLENNVARPEV